MFGKKNEIMKNLLRLIDRDAKIPQNDKTINGIVVLLSLAGVFVLVINGMIFN